MTVRETLDFAARCQGVGDRAGKFLNRKLKSPSILGTVNIVVAFVFLERMAEVTRREKQAGIVPEPDIDTYMKVKTFA